MKMIRTRTQLQALALEHNIHPNWHEPDNQGFTAQVAGTSFDNAGFWGSEWAARAKSGSFGADGVEMFVTLLRNGEPVAEVNLASLFAMACGSNDPDEDSWR